jgi:hypothetical protein
LNLHQPFLTAGLRGWCDAQRADSISLQASIVRRGFSVDPDVSDDVRAIFSLLDLPHLELSLAEEHSGSGTTEARH